MRVDLPALQQGLAAHIAPNVAKVAAGGAIALASLTIAYVVWPGSKSIPSDAVVVSGPMFTPVSATPPVPTPTLAVRKSTAAAAGDDQPLSETRFNDDVNITRSVQRQLKRAGCYDGSVNGVWNAQTRRGMGEFTRRANARLPVDRADPVLLVLLESNQEISCASGSTADRSAAARNDTARSEISASNGEERIAEARETPMGMTRAPEPVSASARTAADDQPGAEDLGYSSESKRAPNPISSVQTASIEERTETGSIGAGEATAVAAAGTGVVPRERASPPERRRTARRYKKQPSLAKSVSKGLKSIQRSLNKLF